MSLTQSIIRGAVTTGDRGAYMHPEEWRKSKYEEMPVGNAPLLSFAQRMSTLPTPSKIFHWTAQAFCKQRGSVTDVYTDMGITAYTSGGVLGTPLYLKMAAADAEQIVPNDILVVADTAHNLRRLLAQTVTVAGANSFVGCKLLETDTSNRLAQATLTWRIGSNAQPEMSNLPLALYEEPQWFENYTQIMMESVELGGREIKELDRLSDIEARSLTRALMRLRYKMNKTFLYGSIKSKTMKGSNNKLMTTTDSIYKAIQDNESANIFNYSTNATYSGQTWLQSGWDFIKMVLEQISRYSDGGEMDNSVTMLLGGLAWQSINDLIEDFGAYQITDATNKFGVKVKRLQGLFMDVDMIVDPTFREDPEFQRSAFIYPPHLIEYVPMTGRDIQYVPAAEIEENGWTWVDGRKSGWYVDCGIQYAGLNRMAWLNDIGVDSTV